jgi:glutamyl-tRNA synthetase
MMKVRYAPSPTGSWHIGTARTALFNYLFAKKNKGKFILRFEDTDQERSTKEAEENILEGMQYLGILWDEGPYFQMQRLSIYQKYVDQLLKEGKAYPCFCTKEEIEKERKEAEAKKVAYRYSGRCCKLSLDQIAKYKKEGKKPAIRFKVSSEKIKFIDLIKGKVEFDGGQIGDPVIMRADGVPIYNLANVIDDYGMKVTHIIRGEDLLSSTPIQILLYQAIGADIPEFAHMPLTFNKDGSKLSKRHGATSITEYRDQGYLPEALINFIVLLGWHPGEGDTREFFTLKELEKEFSTERVGKSASIFDIDKLNWFQEHYIRELATKKSLKEIKQIFNIDIEDKILKKILFVYVIDGRIRFFNDIYNNHKYLFGESKYKSELLVFKKSSKEKTKKGLEEALKSLEKLDSWEKIDDIKKVLHDTVKCTIELNFGDVFWPVRVSLSGQEKSPSPEEISWILGKKESVKRIKKAISLLK